jgi:hypothetical protein
VPPVFVIAAPLIARTTACVAIVSNTVPARAFRACPFTSSLLAGLGFGRLPLFGVALVLGTVRPFSLRRLGTLHSIALSASFGFGFGSGFRLGLWGWRHVGFGLRSRVGAGFSCYGSLCLIVGGRGAGVGLSASPFGQKAETQGG